MQLLGANLSIDILVVIYDHFDLGDFRMIEIFSSDIEYVCKRMQETLDDPNGVLIDALTQVSDDFF